MHKFNINKVTSYHSFVISPLSRRSWSTDSSRVVCQIKEQHYFIWDLRVLGCSHFCPEEELFFETVPVDLDGPSLVCGPGGIA